MGYARAPGVPAVTVRRRSGPGPQGGAALGAHIHDFLVLIYVERGGGKVRVDERTWSVRPGDVVVVAPGTVVTPLDDHDDPAADVWTVFFPADLVDAEAPSSPLAWRAHPLLYPFTRGGRPGGERLHVPAAERAAWLGELTALETELRDRRDGYAEAARAHVTLLLVRLGRLAADVPADLREHDETLVAAVFDALEARFREPITARDVAAAVGRSPGHVTTVVRRRTGRTVGRWVTERRLQEARRLLAGTDLTVTAIAHRVGYRDPGYFIRRFRAAHGLAPQEWRRAG
ncbi:AraC family transcriptional regulator [Actinomycetospora sp. TBRC 11914]|uniref:AraC family transcriptional regulator n=1 Tax=Actinomycetospora sp. TBRC 11914 TaxID=2729387 RepID=UPI00145E78E0|nr:AraC family transcriptional regulator [Actinomycetospora sp. TBRC 11914]NMO88470.1 AraC family transcriptional regulator [Actinomycetospora sp. TBRC 11914]